MLLEPDRCHLNQPVQAVRFDSEVFKTIPTISALAKNPQNLDMSQLTLIWILLGISLCALETVFPTALMALVSGVGALVVAVVAPRLTFDQQMLLWIVLSGLGVWVSRQFVPVRTPSRKFDTTIAFTLTPIPAGGTGRVRYEGGSWLAQCEDPTIAIPPDCVVQVLRQQGTTLFILPAEDRSGE